MARDVLLDYVLKTNVVEPILPASSAYLHNVLCIVPVKSGSTAGIYECTTQAQIAECTEAQCGQLLEAGLSKIYVCAVSAYANAQALIDATEYKFFTILVDSSYATEPTAITGFDGVMGWSTDDAQKAKSFASKATANNTAFIDPDANAGKNMYWAFGKLLSGATWRNQQFIGMPESGMTSVLGTAEQYFEDRLSFVLNSEEFGNRLAFFVNRGRAIVAPYIYEEFQLNLKSWALTYINTNQPSYNAIEASKLESYLLQKANNKYIESGMLDALSIAISADQDNFVMSGNIKVSEPKATWRIVADLQEGGIE